MSRSCRSYPLPSGHRILKKITHPLHDRFRRGSRTSPSLTRLPSAFLSTAAAVCWPRETAPPDCCYRLHRGHRVRPTDGGRTSAHPLPSSFSTMIAQPRSRCAVLRLPDYYVLLKSTCYKRIFRVFIFLRYVASVSDGYCKSRSGCCICCNGCTRMLQKVYYQCFICIF
jgi:hypothetical protein